MSCFLIEGRRRLEGSLRVQGAKNSALPILAAAAATGKPCLIHNCPRISDIDAAVGILRAIGCEVRISGGDVYVDSSNISSSDIPDRLMREMRSSIIFLGALLTRTGEASFTAPGGCDIGQRPFDLHILSLKKLGVAVEHSRGRIRCSCPGRVRSAAIALSFPSVGATENIILASVRAAGTTTVLNAAREPEIADLAGFLNSCGARISGAGSGTVTIEGVERLRSAEYTVMPDRIAACTYMAAAAVTGGNLILEDVITAHLSPVIPSFEQAGCRIDHTRRRLRLLAPERPSSMETIRTMPYPGFPTDCQPVMTAVASVCRGTTFIKENIFENRFRYIGELNRMGADIFVNGTAAVVRGTERLHSAAVSATDLRAGAALVVAGLCAEGTTAVEKIGYIDRGYESLEKKLASIGASIKRTDNYENFKPGASGEIDSGKESQI